MCLDLGECHAIELFYCDDDVSKDLRTPNEFSVLQSWGCCAHFSDSFLMHNEIVSMGLLCTLQ